VKAASGKLDAVTSIVLFAFGCEPDGTILTRDPSLLGFGVTRTGRASTAQLALIGTAGEAVGTAKGGSQPVLYSEPTGRTLDVRMLQMPAADVACKRLLGPTFLSSTFGKPLFESALLASKFGNKLIEVWALHSTYRHLPLLRSCAAERARNAVWQCADAASAVDALRAHGKPSPELKRLIVLEAVITARDLADGPFIAREQAPAGQPAAPQTAKCSPLLVGVCAQAAAVVVSVLGQYKESAASLVKVMVSACEGDSGRKFDFAAEVNKQVGEHPPRVKQKKAPGKPQPTQPPAPPKPGRPTGAAAKGAAASRSSQRTPKAAATLKPAATPAGTPDSAPPAKPAAEESPSEPMTGAALAALMRSNSDLSAAETGLAALLGNESSIPGPIAVKIRDLIVERNDAVAGRKELQREVAALKSQRQDTDRAHAEAIAKLEGQLAQKDTELVQVRTARDILQGQLENAQSNTGQWVSINERMIDRPAQQQPAQQQQPFVMAPQQQPFMMSQQQMMAQQQMMMMPQQMGMMPQMAMQMPMMPAAGTAASSSAAAAPAASLPKRSCHMTRPAA
jgi:hypothetical protein